MRNCKIISEDENAQIIMYRDGAKVGLITNSEVYDLAPRKKERKLAWLCAQDIFELLSRHSAPQVSCFWHVPTIMSMSQYYKLLRRGYGLDGYGRLRKCPNGYPVMFPSKKTIAKGAALLGMSQLGAQLGHWSQGQNQNQITSAKVTSDDVADPSGPFQTTRPFLADLHQAAGKTRDYTSNAMGGDRLDDNHFYDYVREQSNRGQPLAIPTNSGIRARILDGVSRLYHGKNPENWRTAPQSNTADDGVRPVFDEEKLEMVKTKLETFIKTANTLGIQTTVDVDGLVRLSYTADNKVENSVSGKVSVPQIMSETEEFIIASALASAYYKILDKNVQKIDASTILEIRDRAQRRLENKKINLNTPEVVNKIIHYSNFLRASYHWSKEAKEAFEGLKDDEQAQAIVRIIFAPKDDSMDYLEFVTSYVEMAKQYIKAGLKDSGVGGFLAKLDLGIIKYVMKTLGGIDNEFLQSLMVGIMNEISGICYNSLNPWVVAQLMGYGGGGLVCAHLVNRLFRNPGTTKHDIATYLANIKADILYDIYLILKHLNTNGQFVTNKTNAIQVYDDIVRGAQSLPKHINILQTFLLIDGIDMRDTILSQITDFAKFTVQAAQSAATSSFKDLALGVGKGVGKTLYSFVSADVVLSEKDRKTFENIKRVIDQNRRELNTMLDGDQKFKKMKVITTSEEEDQTPVDKFEKEKNDTTAYISKTFELDHGAADLIGTSLIWKELIVYNMENENRKLIMDAYEVLVEFVNNGNYQKFMKGAAIVSSGQHFHNALRNMNRRFCKNEIGMQNTCKIPTSDKVSNNLDDLYVRYLKTAAKVPQGLIDKIRENIINVNGIYQNIRKHVQAYLAESQNMEDNPSLYDKEICCKSPTDERCCRTAPTETRESENICCSKQTLDQLATAMSIAIQEVENNLDEYERVARNNLKHLIVHLQIKYAYEDEDSPIYQFIHENDDIINNIDDLQQKKQEMLEKVKDLLQKNEEYCLDKYLETNDQYISLNHTVKFIKTMRQAHYKLLDKAMGAETVREFLIDGKKLAEHVEFFKSEKVSEVSEVMDQD